MHNRGRPVEHASDAQSLGEKDRTCSTPSSERAAFVRSVLRYIDWANFLLISFLNTMLLSLCPKIPNLFALSCLLHDSLNIVKT